MTTRILDLSQHIIDKMIATKVWQPECPVSIQQLRIIEIEHIDFTGKIQLGQMVIHEKIAEITTDIFHRLLKIKFPIEKIIPIHEYEGNDELSMADNNSSCFNFRKIAGTERLSIHSYGTAIDINPRENPFLDLNKEQGTIEVHPKQGIEFINRTNQRPGMLEQVVSIFTQYGFTWGGEWNDPIDYHHFQIKL